MAEPYPTLAPDGTPWSHPASRERVIAVGDVHGDYEAMIASLIERGLIDARGKWIGGKAQLVMMGDLNDRGPGTRPIMDFLMRLEKDAAGKGGKIHTLIGNHEVLLLRGETRYLSQEDIIAFLDFLPAAEQTEARRLLGSGVKLDKFRFGQGVVNAMRGDTPYAKWIRSHNTMLKIGDTLFVHAGLEDWALTADPAGVNATVREWVRHYQGAGPRPPDRTNWVMGHTGDRGWFRDPAVEGPLWTAIFSQDPVENKGMKIDLGKILAALGVKRVVTGHIMTPDGNILLDHPVYGDKVVMTDSAISRGYPGGKWSSIEIVNGKVTAHYPEMPPELRPPPLPGAIPVAEPAGEKPSNRTIGEGLSDCVSGLVGLACRIFGGGR